MTGKLKLIISLMLLLCLAGCSFNYSESGQKIDSEEDGADLALAKTSLRLIAENKPDSLKQLFDPGVLTKVKPDQLQWLLTNGQKVLKNDIFPVDSLIMVSHVTKKSLMGIHSYRIFIFPFGFDSEQNASEFFKITVTNGKVSGVFLSAHNPENNQ